MNSPPLPCRHHTGQGYQQSQLCVNLSRMCLAVLLSMRISLTRFEAVLMQVNALNSTCRPLTLTFHGPIKLMVISQSALLVWVGDHNHGLLVMLLAIFALQFINVIAQSGVIIISFHQDVPLLGGTI